MFVMAKNEDNIYVKALDEFIERERKYVDYGFCIGGIPAYGVVRRHLRGQYCEKKGVGATNLPIRNNKQSVSNILKSFCQIVKLLFGFKKYKYFVYSFYRTDKIGEVYFDKFTDPLIDNSLIKESYIIFEHNNCGEHKIPRVHSEKVVYTDFIDALAVFKTKVNRLLFKNKYLKEYDRLWSMLDLLMGDVNYNKETIKVLITRFAFRNKIYKRILGKLGIKKLVAPARPVFLDLIYAAKKIGVTVYEVQHGVLSNTAISYSGEVDEPFTPDYFLSYGKLKHPELYAISSDKIVNIGWALPFYMKTIDCLPNSSHENDILVVLNPLTSRSVIEIVLNLAQKFHGVVFCLRPHPTEAIPKELQKQIDQTNNVIIQNSSVNCTYALSMYNNVIGDNSTMMNEAFAEGKKVGRLSYPGFSPLYLNEEEEEKTWKIYDGLSFKAYLDAEPFHEIKTSVYSAYNRELVDRLFD